MHQDSSPDGGTDLLSRESLTFVEHAAAVDEPLLLLGETGTGKSVLARIIHKASARAGHRFRSVNCGAVPESLFEREMFGHIRGAFTDAKDSQPGIFEAAHRGTLFLDEIGELPLALQPKLLSVLEDRSIRRIGSTHDVPVDVRVITATNVDIAALARQRLFRADLYHRVAVLSHMLRPLRERRADLPRIVARVLHRQPGGSAYEVSTDAMQYLRAYRWPGNLRELDNALRHARVFARARVIEPEHLPAAVTDAADEAREGERSGRYVAPREPVEERDRILEALKAEGGHRTRTAHRLGMSRTSLWVKVQRHGIRIPVEGGNDQAAGAA